MRRTAAGILPAAFLFDVLWREGVRPWHIPAPTRLVPTVATITGNGTDGQPKPSQARSSKVYVMGTTPGVRVPMREVLLTPTRLAGGR